MINFYFELFAGDVGALGWWELFITLGYRFLSLTENCVFKKMENQLFVCL